MNLSSSREFLIINKYKEFINILDNLIENIPKKDYFDERFNLDDNYIIGLVTSTFIQHENKIGE